MDLRLFSGMKLRTKFDTIIKQVSDKMKEYLEYHRNNIFE